MTQAPATDPAKVDQIEQRVRGAFLELALQVGGIVALHPIQDDAVFALSRSVEKAFRSCLAPLADLRTPAEGAAPVINMRRHPAVLHLLSLIENRH